MLKIAICDDEQLAVRQLKEYIDEYARSKNEDVKTALFVDAFNLIRTNEFYDMILLDIQMAGVDGMEAAKRMRKSGNLSPILFITGSKKYVYEAFDVGAVHYLLKPIDKHKLFDTLDKAFSKKPGKYLLIKQGFDYQKLNEADILYLEAANRKIHVFSINGEYCYYDRLERVFREDLTDDFVRCHRSYVVNLAYVQAIDSNEVLLESGDRIPIAKGSRGDLSRALLNYFKENSHD